MVKNEAIEAMKKIIDFLDWIECSETGGYDNRNRAKEVLKYIEDSVSRGVCDQILWERDVCLAQLNEIGKTLGSKMDDIVALLPKKPHLMTLDEIHALKPGACVYVEWLDEDTLHRGIELGVVSPDEDIHFDGTYQYLKTYEPCWAKDFKERVWSSKPTQEERNETPWEQLKA